MSTDVDKPQLSGRIVRAPEGHLDAAVLEPARKARRSFMGRALAMGAGAAGAAVVAGPRGADGDPAILTLPEHSRAAGRWRPMAATASLRCGRRACGVARARA